MEEKKLKEYSLKQTKSREQILNILRESKIPLCAEEILAKIETNINQSTVYRTLTLLTTKGIIIKTIRENQVAYYQITEKHRHSLLCKECNEVIMLETCPLGEILKEIKEKTGYEITGHSLEISGICSKCKSKK